MTRNERGLVGLILLIAVVGVFLLFFWPGWAVSRTTTTAPPPAPTAVPTTPPKAVAPAPASGVVPIPPSQPGSGQPPQVAPFTGVCRLDKVATWSEVNSGGPQRLEIGGGGVQHADFYPNRRVKAVSYIVPRRSPMIWSGFGSLWEAPNSAECEAFNWLKDTTDYARGRLGNDHSGLVIDLRGSTPQIVANVGNMSRDDIDSLLAQHRVAQSGAVSPATSGVQQQAQQPAPAQPQGPATASGPACQETREDRSPVVNQPWTPKGDWRIVNFWSNQPGASQQERKLLLRPSENPSLLGGGSSWSWPASCESTVLAEFAKNPKPEVTLAQLRVEGLAR